MTPVRQLAKTGAERGEKRVGKGSAWSCSPRRRNWEAMQALPCYFSAGFPTALAAAQLVLGQIWAWRRRPLSSSASLFIYLLVFRGRDSLALGYCGQDASWPLSLVWTCLSWWFVLISSRGQAEGTPHEIQISHPHPSAQLGSSLDYQQQEAIQFWVKMWTGDLPKLHNMLAAR